MATYANPRLFSFLIFVWCVQQGPVLAVRLEQPSSDAAAAIVSVPDNVTLTEHIAHVIVKNTLARGLASALLKRNVMGSSSVCVRIHGVHVNMLPPPMFALKRFFDGPAEGDTRDMHMDIELTRCTASIGQVRHMLAPEHSDLDAPPSPLNVAAALGGGALAVRPGASGPARTPPLRSSQLLRAVVGQLRLVRKSLPAGKELIVFRANEISYVAVGGSLDPACTPAAFSVSAEQCVNGSDMVLTFGVEGKIEGSLTSNDLALVTSFLDQINLASHVCFISLVYMRWTHFPSSLSGSSADPCRGWQHGGPGVGQAGEGP